MADTINISIDTPDTWVEVANGSTGTASVNGGGQHCVHTGVPPVTLVGHRFTGELVSFSLATGESLYIKSTRNRTTVVVTED